MRKIFFITLFFYLLTLLETSFLLHFTWFSFPSKFGFGVNLVFIIVVLINLFEPRQSSLGIFLALLAGFFLDVFSEIFFGFWVLILLGVSIFIKFILKKHIQLQLKFLSFKR